jgi:hypothetical protein
LIEDPNGEATSTKADRTLKFKNPRLLMHANCRLQVDENVGGWQPASTLLNTAFHCKYSGREGYEAVALIE